MAFNNKELTAELLRLADTDVKRCVQCGRCSATCPMGDKMIAAIEAKRAALGI